MDLHQIKRLHHTLKHLKFTQVYHQVKYRLFKAKRVAARWDGAFAQVDLADFPKKQKSLSIGEDMWRFNFLNLEKSFSQDSIDWSFRDYGMLWTYNLNYFDWLHQPDMSKEQGLDALSQYFSTPVEKNSIILHPYPTSLRIINTAKFIAKWNITEDWLYNELIADLKFLSRRLEYHLLANHLLENAFALYIGGLITNQGEFIQKGKNLLIRELKEQVLNDGMHYERSPMYHLIILERSLDALNFAKATSDDLESTLQSYVVRMTGFAMNWEDLDRIPMMQDSAYDIALPVPEVLKYSKILLGEYYPFNSNELKDSGYRKLKVGSFSMFVNVGSIGPSYQPGHAHADELNFELFFKGAPIIVDTGISTYEKNFRRQEERSTSSHNCVTIGSKNSSDVWSGFRVGKRAKVINESSGLMAQHNGYTSSTVSRSWKVVDSGILIIDEVLKKGNQIDDVKGRIHIHPDIEITQIDPTAFSLGKNLLLSLNYLGKKGNACLERYEYANGYNRIIASKVIIYNFDLRIKIKICETNQNNIILN